MSRYCTISTRAVAHSPFGAELHRADHGVEGRLVHVLGKLGLIEAAWSL